MVIRLEELERLDLRIIPVSLSLEGVVMLSDTFIFVVDNPIPMLLGPYWLFVATSQR